MHEYPQTIEVLEDEPIEIPVPCYSLTHGDLSLIKYSGDGYTVENKFSNFSISVEPGHGFGNLTINSLDKGFYKLEIKRLNVSIGITVHEGVYWEADGFILKKNSIIEIRNNAKYLRIHSIDIERPEEKKQIGNDASSTLRFTLSDTDESTRAHVYAFTYLPDQPNEGYKQMRQQSSIDTPTEVFSFSKWQNVFQSNRKLGDEYRYVFNRKNAKRFIGNTLERPQLIMKRLKVRDTTFDNEVVKDGALYDSIAAEKSYSRQARGAPEMMARKLQGRSGGGISYENNLHRIQCQFDNIYGFQNFLKHATLVRKNLHPKEDGTVE